MTTATIVDAAERQLVVFDLAGESYGVNIGTVREIIRMQAVTHVPETPEFVEGVINLRGRVIPVVDLRKRFGLAGPGGLKDLAQVQLTCSGFGSTCYLPRGRPCGGLCLNGRSAHDCNRHHAGAQQPSLRSSS